MTGIPQFDFYAQKYGLVSRKEFCKKFSFDPNKKIILFSSSNSKYDDSQQVRLIKRYIDKGKLNNVQVLIRPHVGYRGDADRFKGLDQFDDFVIDRSDKQQNDKFRDNWDTSKEYISNLFNSLYHADVCVNVSSTMTFDATACGTPVINISFDVYKNIEFDKSAKRFFNTHDYYDAVIDTQGTWLVESEESFLSALKDILEKGMRKEKGMQRMIDYFMYKVDGNSAERIANTLISLATPRAC